jgi:chromosome segregation ATPase
MSKTRILSTSLMLLALAVTAPRAMSQISITKKTASGQQTPQPTTSKQAGITQTSPGQAEYNVGLLVKRIVSLEAQLAVLQKQNAGLASEISILQKRSDTLTAQNKNLADQLKGVHAEQVAEISNTNSKLKNFDSRLNQLDSSHHALNSSYQSHTHYMPAFGQQVLSSIPGMQEIANKAGVGYVKSQWENYRILFLGQYSPGISVTGPIYKQ